MCFVDNCMKTFSFALQRAFAVWREIFGNDTGRFRILKTLSKNLGFFESVFLLLSDLSHNTILSALSLAIRMRSELQGVGFLGRIRFFLEICAGNEENFFSRTKHFSFRFCSSLSLSFSLSLSLVFALVLALSLCIAPSIYIYSECAKGAIHAG